MNLVWGFVLKHWVKLLPILVAVGLALCVRHTIQANARASAYARVAEMTSHYAQTQEAKRMIERKQAEDSISKVMATMAQRETARNKHWEGAQKAEATLRDELRGDQRVALDSMASHYQQVIVSLQQDKSDVAEILMLRTKERDDAEQSVRNLENANAQLRVQIAAIQPGSSTLWKIATAVAVVGGIVAYASHP